MRSLTSKVVGLLLLSVALLGFSGDVAWGSRLVSLGTTGNPPYSDGQVVLWSAGAGAAWTVNPLTGRHERIPLPGDGCRVTGAGGGMVALGCPATATTPAGPVLWNRRTGAEIAIPGWPGVSDVGTQWVRTFLSSDCYHCDSVAYRNWHTGEEHVVPDMSDVPIDLDRPTFTPLALRVGGRDVTGVVRTGSTRVVASSAPGDVHDTDVRVIRRGRTRVLGRCAVTCGGDLLVATPTTAAWIDGLDQTLRLHSARLDGSHPTSWRVPRPHGDGLRLLTASGAAVLVVHSAQLNASTHLYRAVR